MMLCSAGLTFLPKTLYQDFHGGKILYLPDPKAGEDCAFRNPVSNNCFGRGGSRIPKDRRPIRSLAKHITLAGSLAGWWAPGSFPVDECAVPHASMRGVRPATVKANSQDSLVGLRANKCFLVFRVSIAFLRGNEPSSKHCA
jgi:hypothetical protein